MTTVEQTEVPKRIKTNIKFTLDSNNEPIGFVKKVNSSWRGCYDNDPDPHKIVVVDHDLQPDIVAGYLYHCSLLNMKNGHGFVAVNATMLMHTAHIEVDVKCYRVKVIFGNRSILYDPIGGITADLRSKEAALKALGKRLDITNIDEITSDFIDACYEIDKLIKNS